jgi:hypothetical protein
VIARRFILLLLALTLCLPLAALAAQVSASLDRNQVALGETVTLNLRVDGDASLGLPDLTGLQGNFDIVGSSSSTNVSIINGRRQVQLTYGIALRPKRVGSLLVPPIQLAAGLTPALKLEVTAPSQQPEPAAAANRAQFLESSAQPDHGYVGQQLLYVTRLYFANNLSSGSLDDPQAPGLEVRRLGDDINYSAERNGQPYHVIERRYAMIPQRAGQVQIPAVGFQGQVIDPNDPDSFFGAGTPIRLSAPAQTLQIKPAPALAGQAAWLPARQLSLQLEGLPADGQARVDQPLNLSMSVQATGLPSETLPALSLPALDDATVYPDKPSNVTRNDGQWLIGRRVQAFAVVPSRPGRLHIPAVTLNWWNVQTDRAEMATIPAHDLTVLPALGAPAAPTTAAPIASTAASSTSTLTDRPAPAPLASSATRWRWIALASLALWLLSLLGWLLLARRRRASSHLPTPRPSKRASAAVTPGQAQQAFLQAASGEDSAAQAHLLLDWARLERPALALQNLGELAAALADEEQRAAIAALQRARYAGAAPVGGLRSVFASGLHWRRVDAAEEDSPLPSLYPFKLR